MTSKNEHSSASQKKAEGQKGVTQEQVGSDKDKDPNNFANDPERLRRRPQRRAGKP